MAGVVPDADDFIDDSSLEDCAVSVVVPAAGSGTRLGAEVPKQYIKIAGVPLIIYCLREFSSISWINNIVLVADDVELVKKVLQEHHVDKVSVVQGATTRHRSIKQGMLALSHDPPDVVVVHDGVRPLVPYSVLKEVVKGAITCGAAGSVRPLVSTVVMPNDTGHLQESLVRGHYFNSEMPQAFQYNIISSAYNKCSTEDLDHGTECLALALRYEGIRAKLVSGTPELWKVTHNKDLELAKIEVPKHTRKIYIVAPPCPLDHSGEEEEERTNLEMESSGEVSVVSEAECVSEEPAFIGSLIDHRRQSYFFGKEINLIQIIKYDKAVDFSSSNCNTCAFNLQIINKVFKPLFDIALSVNVCESMENLKQFGTELKDVIHVNCMSSLNDLETIVNTTSKTVVERSVHKIIFIFTLSQNSDPRSNCDILRIREIFKKYFEDLNIDVSCILRFLATKGSETQPYKSSSNIPDLFELVNILLNQDLNYQVLISN